MRPEVKALIKHYAPVYPLAIAGWTFFIEYMFLGQSWAVLPSTLISIVGLVVFIRLNKKLDKAREAAL